MRCRTFVCIIPVKKKNLFCFFFCCEQIWVPTIFHADVFIRGGVDPNRVRTGLDHGSTEVASNSFFVGFGRLLGAQYSQPKNIVEFSIRTRE